MVPGSEKNSIWLATIDSGRATGLVVGATITLSPTPLRANVGLVALFADRKNHVVCKLEVNHGHPAGLLAIGDEREGLTTSLLAARDEIGLVEGSSYRLELRVPPSLADSPIVCTVSGEGMRRSRVAYRLSDAGIATYGAGTGQGLRIKIFDDEDDGRSTWDHFLVTPAGA